MSKLYWHFAAMKDGMPVMRDGTTLLTPHDWWEIEMLKGRF